MGDQALRPISREQFARARQAELATDAWEIDPAAATYPLVLRQAMPVQYAAYCAYATPWFPGYRDEQGEVGFDTVGEPFDSFPEAYAAVLGQSVPRQFTLDTWHRDFLILETEHVFSPSLARCLQEHAGMASVAYYRRIAYEEPEHFTIDLDLLLRLPKPFVQLDSRLGRFDVFPEGCAWYLVMHDLEPIFYLGGTQEMVECVMETCRDRVVRMALGDRFY